MKKEFLISTFIFTFFVLSVAGQNPRDAFNKNSLTQHQVSMIDYLALSNNSLGWWSKSYLLDYLLIAGGTMGYVTGKGLEPREKSLIGPSYDPDNLLELFQSDRLSKPHLQQDVEEAVPEYWIHRSIAGMGALLVGIEWREQQRGRGSVQQIHDVFVGYAQSVALNAMVTEFSKPLFSRLRPDFRERALRFHCPDLDGPEFEPYCADFRDNPLSDNPEEVRDLFDDGRKSFISGHSSNAFNLFGYTTLAIGGRYVWGTDASPGSRKAGIAAQSVLMSAAAYISVSRITDGRHHVSDVIAGAATGTLIANLSYWLRFNRDGNSRRSLKNSNSFEQNANNRFRDNAEVQLSPWVAGANSGGGFSLSVSF